MKRLKNKKRTSTQKLDLFCQTFRVLFHFLISFLIYKKKLPLPTRRCIFPNIFGKRGCNPSHLQDHNNNDSVIMYIVL